MSFAKEIYCLTAESENWRMSAELAAELNLLSHFNGDASGDFMLF